MTTNATRVVGPATRMPISPSTTIQANVEPYAALRRSNLDADGVPSHAIDYVASILPTGEVQWVREVGPEHPTSGYYITKPPRAHIGNISIDGSMMVIGGVYYSGEVDLGIGYLPNPGEPIPYLGSSGLFFAELNSETGATVWSRGLICREARSTSLGGRRPLATGSAPAGPWTAV